MSSPLRTTTLPEKFDDRREEQGEKKETWEEPHGKDPSERPLPCKPTVLRFSHGSATLRNDYVSSGALSICNNGNSEASVQMYRRLLANR